jgi:hypothetical protein
MDAGVDRRTVAKYFDPESAIWTPVQFREAFSTVEWRSPDTALPSQVIGLADRLASVVARLDDTPVRIEGERGEITDEAIVLPEFDAVIGYVNDAIREGVASQSVRNYLDRMGFDVDAYDPITHEIDGQTPVSPAAAREIRLEHADRLADDVRRAAAAESD